MCVFFLCPGNSQMGATIVDALDSLYMMGLHDEFKDGQEWIEQNLDFSVVSREQNLLVPVLTPGVKQLHLASFWPVVFSAILFREPKTSKQHA